jgi:glyoxylase-like metal-dependent hydrolase (beta-lactamase superfamily II)
VPLASRHVDGSGIEVIPTPGHSPGSTSYLVPGVNGQSYLFTGDTIMLGAEGHWVAGYIPPISDATPLGDSLRLLGTLKPDLVISSAFPGETAVHVPGPLRWADCVKQARTRLAAVA